jgi:peptide/nickel transport system permease protein
MSQATLPLPKDAAPEAAPAAKKGTSTLSRVLRYSLVRAVALFATIVVGVYLTILIANMGGHVDVIRKAFIRDQVALGFMGDREFQQLPRAERERIIADIIAVEEARLGLDRPFLIRSFGFLGQALSLNLGRAEVLTSDSGSAQVRLVLLERLPPTLLLFATANFLIFFVSIFFALALSRSYGSVIDRAVIALAPTSAAPGWFYGLFLIVVFAAVLGWMPFGGMVAAPPPKEPLAYAVSLLKHLTLPVTALVLATIFLQIYSWRTFFLIYSSEDYVDMAKAKGLPARTIERRYILRPTLPTIITTFALTLIALWTGAVVLETVFNWPGLGRLLFQAIGVYDTPIIVGSTVIYAYLLAVTVFVLDFVYALVDPRVKVGGEERKV